MTTDWLASPGPHLPEAHTHEMKINPVRQLRHQPQRRRRPQEIDEASAGYLQGIV
jgi:hypothetical protein